MREDFSVDPYLARKYVIGEYTCSEFARDVWLDLTGDDIGERLRLLHVAATDRRITAGDYKTFQRLPEAASPCIALLRRPRTVPHMGVYLRRRILHLNGLGAFFQTPRIALMGFKTVSYYR